MRPWLVGIIVVGSIVAGVATEVMVFGIAEPPQATAAFIGGLWLAIPYLTAIGLALLLRWHGAALVVLAAVFILVTLAGLSLIGNSASEYDRARHEVATAVQPGEDPNSGPANMRKSGAEMDAFFIGAFTILVAVVVPPVQFVAILIAGAVGFAVSALLRRRKGEPTAARTA